MAVIQRFGGALNLNVHIHALVLDGVFANDEAGALVFHQASRLTALDVAEVLATVEPWIRRLLDRRGLGDDDVATAQDAWADASPVLAGFAAASVQGVVAMGQSVAARASGVSVRQARPFGPRSLGAVTRAPTASICMPVWWYPPGTAADSNGSVATPSVRRCRAIASV